MTVTLSAEEFNTLARLALQIEVLELRAHAAIGQALATRNAYYATLAAAHGLPPTFATLGLNDATFELEVTGPAETMT